MKFYYSVLALLIIACSSTEKEVEKVGDIDKKGIIAVNMNHVENRSMNLSEVVESVEIIPLETGKDFLIAHPTVVFAKDFILVGSQTGFKKPARLFRFSREGKFLNEIGKGGNGPGEHIGIVAGNLRYHETDSTVQVNWGGSGRQPQLFDRTGNFMKEVKLPLTSIISAERWDDAIWLAAPLSSVGQDSSKLLFFKENGDIIHSIRKKPVSTNPFALPESPNMYLYQDSWNLFYDDTLFTIKKDVLIPQVVFSNEKKVQWNLIKNIDDLDGKEIINPIYESKSYWFLRKSSFVKEGVSGKQFLGRNENQPVIVVDKKSLKPYSITWTDDILSSFLTVYLAKATLRFGNDRNFFAIDADKVAAMMKNLPNDIKPSLLQELNKIRNIKPDDNPVIFSFALKDSVRF